MQTSTTGRKFIEIFEGLFLHAYPDSGGVLTIGYGHTTAAGGPPVYSGQKITAVEADKLLADDLARVERSVRECIDVPLTQPEFDALVSFDFNTGRLHGGTIAGKINSGHKADAMQTLLEYNHVNRKVVNGLTRRRKAEKLMFEGDVAGAMKLAGTSPERIKPSHVAVAAGTGAAITHVAQNGPPPTPVLVILVVLAVVAAGFYIWRNVLKKTLPEAVK